MCSSVRPSRSTCVRAAAIRRSMSALPTTRPSISVLAVNVRDFNRPHATDRNTSSTLTPAARSACATAARTVCSASSSATTTPALEAPRRLHADAPARARDPARLPTWAMAAIRHTVLLLPMSSRPTISLGLPARLRDSLPRDDSNACSDAAGRHSARPRHVLRPAAAPAARARACGRQRAGRSRWCPPRAAACASAGARASASATSLGRQLDGAAAEQPQRPAPLADALGDLDPAHQIRIAGEQSAKSAAASAAAPSPATRGSAGAVFGGTVASTRPVLSIR